MSGALPGAVLPGLKGMPAALPDAQDPLAAERARAQLEAEQQAKEEQELLGMGMMFSLAEQVTRRLPLPAARRPAAARLPRRSPPPQLRKSDASPPPQFPPFPNSLYHSRAGPAYRRPRLPRLLRPRPRPRLLTRRRLLIGMRRPSRSAPAALRSRGRRTQTPRRRSRRVRRRPPRRRAATAAPADGTSKRSARSSRASSLSSSKRSARCRHAHAHARTQSRPT